MVTRSSCTSSLDASRADHVSVQVMPCPATERVWTAPDCPTDIREPTFLGYDTPDGGTVRGKAATL